MALPWVRLDSNIGSHDKILALLSDPSPKRWQAAFSYCSALGWAGGHGTDGAIPRAALPFVHGTDATARLLCKYRLWEARTADWLIVNYAERQQLEVVTASKKEDRRIAAEKANCHRWHGPTCWGPKGCGRNV
jgi:hypothetical protein